MDSIRQNKISRIILKDLSDIFQKDAYIYFPGGMITVTTVRVSPDLSLAKAYLSIFPEKNKKEVFDLINSDKKSIRNKLSQKIGKQMRIVPELAFFIDDSCDYLENIENLLKN